jgi:hypothetical protein
MRPTACRGFARRRGISTNPTILPGALNSLALKVYHVGTVPIGKLAIARRGRHVDRRVACREGLRHMGGGMRARHKTKEMQDGARRPSVVAFEEMMGSLMGSLALPLQYVWSGVHSQTWVIGDAVEAETDTISVEAMDDDGSEITGVVISKSYPYNSPTQFKVSVGGDAVPKTARELYALLVWCGVKFAESNTPGYTDDAPPSSPADTSQPGMGEDDLNTKVQEGVAARLLRELRPAQLARVLEHTTLAGLMTRYEKGLAELDVKPNGFTSKEQADTAANVAVTLRRLQELQAQLGLPVTETPEHVQKGEAMAAKFRRSHDETGAPIPSRPRGRPRREVTQARASARR